MKGKIILSTLLGAILLLLPVSAIHAAGWTYGIATNFSKQ